MSGDPQEIRFGTIEGQLYLGFRGAATHRASSTADKIVAQFLGVGPSAPTVVLDLADCGWIDSTFAGWMIRMQKQLALHGGKLIVSRCQEGCRSSLNVMGLLPLFELRTVAVPSTLARLVCPEEEMDAATIEFLAAAHESLGAASQTNGAMFTRIAEQLRRELRERKG